MSKLIEKLPELVVMGFFGDGVSESKAFHIIIQVLIRVPSLITVEMSERVSDCFYAIWKSLNGTRKITEEEALQFINEYMTEHGQSPIDISEYYDIIRQLVKFDFIDLVEGCILIKEMVFFIKKNGF